MGGPASAPPVPPQPAVPPGWAHHRLLALAARDLGLLDGLALGVIAAGLARNWGILSLADVAFLGAAGAAFGANVAWRRTRPESWARHREACAAALRLVVAASPTAWTITHAALAGAPPYGASAALNACVFALCLLFCSFSATGTVLALARPVRLALHLPAHALAILLIAQRNGAICATAALQHPAARSAAAATYFALTLAARAALPLPVAVPAHGAEGTCRAVLGLAELLLGVAVPTLVLAAAEAGLYRQWSSAWLEWQQQQQQQRLQQQRREQAGSSAASGSACPAGATAAAAAVAPPPPRAVACLDTRAHPFLQPPGPLATRMYELLGACLALRRDPADAALAACVAGQLLCAAWQVIQLMTPP